MQESIIFINQNLSEKVHYVYRVTIDGKYYIGKRTGFLNDLVTGRYKTSSKLIWEKLQNGMTFSKIKILQVFSSPKEALEFEKRILMRVNAKANPKFLNQHNGNGNYTFKQHTEETKEKMKEYFNPETEEGRKQREKRSNKRKEYFNPETEQGRNRRKHMSNKKKDYFNPETEQGRFHSEENRRRGVERFNSNTEEGRKRRENASEKTKAQFDKNTELGRKRREYLSKKQKEKAKEQLQKRKDASILGDLMFDEAFIKENFLIKDDKNNLRFLWSVYSKLSGYKKGSIIKQKREGKLSFLYGIKSISISEEQENAKIKEIEAIIKSRNEELSLKAF